MAKALTVAALEKLKADPARRVEIPDGLLTGLYHVIQPSGARSWAVRYRAGGKPRKLTLGTYPALELSDARKAAQEALRDAAKGKDPAGEKQTAKRAHASEALAFGGVVRQYLARDARKNRSWIETARLLGLRPGADPADVATFEIIGGSIVAAWSGRNIGEIPRRDILARLDAIVDRGAPIVANRTLAALRRLFNWSIERGLIDASPCAAIKAPAAEQSRDRILSDDEIRWLWKATGKVGFPFGPLARILLLTGQRRDEVAGMTAAEMDLEGQLWTIPRQRAKNNQEHHVPLAPQTVAAIEALPRIAGKGFIFTTNGETHVSGWSRSKDILDREMLAIARADSGDDKLTIPNWTYHDLRRTAASGMARLGHPVHVVERLLNHRSGTIRGVAAVYNRHDYWEERAKAAVAWARQVLEIADHG